jgi:hypothetical protein
MTALFQRSRDIEGDEKLVLHHQDAFGFCHSSPVPCASFGSGSLSFRPHPFIDFRLD